MNETKQDTESVDNKVNLNIVPLKTDKSKVKSSPNQDNGTIPKTPCSMLMCGSSGSGKTQLLLNLLTRREFYKDFFDIIFVFSNTAGESDDLYNHLNIPDENIFLPNTAGLEQLEHIIKIQKKIIKKKGIDKSPSILLIFDDLANERKFIASDTYFKLHIMNRHYNTTVISLFQSYMKCARSCRTQISALFYFKGKASETLRISSEHCPDDFTEKEFIELVKYATDDPYSFLFVNYKVDNRKERYRKCLHTIMELNK